MNVEDTILYHSPFCSQILVYSDVIYFFAMLNSHMLCPMLKRMPVIIAFKSKSQKTIWIKAHFC